MNTSLLVSVTTTSNDKRYHSTLFSNDLLPPREGTRNISDFKFLNIFYGIIVICLNIQRFCLIGGLISLQIFANMQTNNCRFTSHHRTLL